MRSVWPDCLHQIDRSGRFRHSVPVPEWRNQRSLGRPPRAGPANSCRAQNGGTNPGEAAAARFRRPLAGAGVVGRGAAARPPPCWFRRFVPVPKWRDRRSAPPPGAVPRRGLVPGARNGPRAQTGPMGAGRPMRMSWHDLLFAHAPVPVAALRRRRARRPRGRHVRRRRLARRRPVPHDAGRASRPAAAARDSTRSPS